MKHTNYKEKLYETYHSSHTKHLYGEVSLSMIKKNFAVWDMYFGSLLPQDKNASILDIGCGFGSFVYYLNERGYKRSIGVDISREQVEAGINAGISNLYVDDFQVFLQDHQEKFDLIIARDVIEHFDKQQAFQILCQVADKLSNNGAFLMQVPNGQGFYYTSIFFGDYTHEMAYTESSIRQLSMNCGFSAAECYPTGPLPIGFFGCIRTAFWWLKVKSLRFWKLVETGSAKGIFTSNLIAICKK